MPDNEYKESMQPLHIEGVTDFHVHCDYSIDAVGSVDQYCQAALYRNLAEICFTTHYDSNPNGGDRANFIRINGENKLTSVENLEPYVDHVLRAADQYYLQGISVKLGVEIGYYPGCEEEVIRLKEKYPLDYILCGIHEIDNICFCCKHDVEKCFSRYSMNEAVEKYFSQVNSAAKSKHFDTIAHLGYYLKYARQFYGEEVLDAHLPYLDETFRILKESGTALEINTAAIRHGLKQYYPSVDIINRAKKAGVDIVHLGSDAHRPEDVGFDFEAATALVPNNVTGCEG